MATAVLLVNMPKNCYQCELWHTTDEDDDFCGANFKTVNPIADERPDWCPLIPQTDDETAWYDQGYIDGWNDCLDSDGDFTKRKPWRRDD